ncbi:hypothetical protein E1A91_D03G038300v1 [Gossypium mustelinum]|uniref:Uncharacterized protein isoform X1 n=5 Tax=Gossypium TaxID=3633 RepID=A0ABM2ZSE8_GOSHI|nr:uncharacterized protein LOC107950477 isoform X1 [Gossypium hirsutum]PPD88139.1 hypothetical protein GOBAR_DD14913 [Gossypium barbadense]TYI89201.1 hypothetical protein E1A91_D03G038300v1 [Gossypium mustelinum]
MAVSFPGFPWWFWGNSGNKEKQLVSNGSSLNSSDWGLGLREPETVKFPTKIASTKGKPNWQGNEERRVVDKEYDLVMVPSDGVHLSGYESDGPEWSIGWEEPHGPGFHGEDDDDGFAVLVPCYRPGCKELVESPNNQLLSAIKNLPTGFSSDFEAYMLKPILLGNIMEQVFMELV